MIRIEMKRAAYMLRIQNLVEEPTEVEVAIADALVGYPD